MTQRCQLTGSLDGSIHAQMHTMQFLNHTTHQLSRSNIFSQRFSFFVFQHSLYSERIKEKPFARFVVDRTQDMIFLRDHFLYCPSCVQQWHVVAGLAPCEECCKSCEQAAGCSGFGPEPNLENPPSRTLFKCRLRLPVSMPSSSLSVHLLWVRSSGCWEKSAQ